MDQTPAHEHHNPDLLRMMPTQAKVVFEVGCSSGALAREYKKINPQSRYLGSEIDDQYAQLARRYCDDVCVGDIEQMGDEFWQKNAQSDCWVFGDVLEHLKNPWNILSRIRAILPEGGSVVCCIPNAQHWSIPARLSVGDFRYEDSGLLDRTHLRWFTRKTLIQLFDDSGFKLTEMISRIFDEPQREDFISLIKRLAQRAGGNPEEAARDAMPLQYVIKAVAK